MGETRREIGPSGVWNMPEPLRSSLVGLALRGWAGRGEGVGIGGHSLAAGDLEILIPVTSHTCTTITFSTTNSGMFFFHSHYNISLSILQAYSTRQTAHRLF